MSPRDYVLKGQKIGKANGVISANVISSVSGLVKAIEQRQTSSGEIIESIIIDNDNKYQEVLGLGEKEILLNFQKKK